MRIMAFAIIAFLIAVFPLPAVADEPESGLFAVTDEMCSLKWYRSQGTVKTAGSVSGGVADIAGNPYDVHVSEAVLVDRRTGENEMRWRYQYLLLNCGDMPITLFTVPGLPSRTHWALETIYGRVTSVIRLDAHQGIRFVFYDNRPPTRDVERIAYVLSPVDASRMLGFGITFYMPDPSFPEW